MIKKWQLLVLAILAFSGLSFTQPPGSSLNQASVSMAGGYSFKGKVKAMSFGDTTKGDPIKIKFLNLNKGAVNSYETVKVCDIHFHTANSFLLEQKMQIIRDAMKSGQVIEVSYDNLFDRCLKDFSVSKS